MRLLIISDGVLWLRSIAAVRWRADEHGGLHRVYRLLPLIFVHAISVGHDIGRGKLEQI